MSIRKDISDRSRAACQAWQAGLGKLLVLGLALVSMHCAVTDEDDTRDIAGGGSEDGLIGVADGPGPGSGSGTGDPGGPGRGVDTLRQPQAGQLTAGEIDDHLNFPQFKAYVQRALQAAGQTRLEYSLPDAPEKTDRFAGRSPRPRALDLAFAIDATGSMGDEMSYLAAEFQSIVGRVQDRHPDVSIRFGLVFYRDQGDDYVVQSHAFRTSVEETRALLAKQRAGGGGDTPEAMDKGLAAAVDLGWRGDASATQLLFLVADAPPHEAGVKPFLETVDRAKSKGIRIYPLAASSTDELTELLMRIAAYATSGSYAFLTDDSGIGNAHKEPSIPCYVVTRLDALLTRLIESEIAGERIEPEPASILRESGRYEEGRCLEDQDQAAGGPNQTARASASPA